jgi:hypothetical protein
MTLIYILLGILIAATLFGSLLWSFTQAFRRSGLLRNAYLALVLLTIGGMATVSWGLNVEMRLVGVGLLIFGAIAVVSERGSSRLLPLVQVLFGLVLLLGLPITYLLG